ncbi:hypothetical protein [Pseudomonas izuensis]|uniref:Uncharacterized protein n=1 Tax=Pseudomonas izuensis TaxID=2684212 RepID=A0ABM7RM58_9PSED|nr:hypothetical protein [Pseudomonas izuensis]BCX66120.1 hypothetical protein LAB08_R07350 [Pseudomonas izuensis]
MDKENKTTDEDLNPKFSAPRILEPKNSVVSPGFRIYGLSPIPADQWNLEVLVVENGADNKVLDVLLETGGPLNDTCVYQVSPTLINAGAKFWFRLDYKHSFGIWSPWANSGGLVMGLGKPEITSPITGTTVGRRPRISGKGGLINGPLTATVRLYRAGSRDVLGLAPVLSNDGSWNITPTNDLPTGDTELVVDQSTDGVTYSPLSDGVKVFVADNAPAPPPVLDKPLEGSYESSEMKPNFEGSGKPDSTLILYEADSNKRLAQSPIGPDGRFKFTIIRDPLPAGIIKVRASQVSNGVESGFTPIRTFTLY